MVGRNLPDPEQSSAIRVTMPLLQMPLVRQKRLALHEKQGKRRKPHVSHRVRRNPQPRLSAKPLQTVRNPANSSSKISMPQKITPQGPCKESTSVHHLELLQVGTWFGAKPRGLLYCGSTFSKGPSSDRPGFPSPTGRRSETHELDGRTWPRVGMSTAKAR
jgi:hypothetical protein